MSIEDKSLFFRHIREKVVKGREEAKRTQEEEKKHREDQFVARYTPLLYSLSQIILKNWKMKVETAADRRYWKTNLFVYREGARLSDQGEITYSDDGVAVAFLMNGPRNSCDFWKSKGLTPVMEQVQAECEPARVRTYYAGRQVGNVVVIDFSEEPTPEN